MAKPPKMIPNPAYYEDEATKDEFKEMLDEADLRDAEFGGAGRAFLEGRISASEFASVTDREMMLHFPEDFGLDIPEEGAWVMVKHPPKAEFTVPVLSIWWAREVTRPGMALGKGKFSKAPYPRRLAEVITPDGPLSLYPHEYTKVKDITKWMGLEADGVEMHWMGADGIDHDALFYMQCRGISRKDALIALLPEAGGPHVYFTLPEEYAAYFGLVAA